MRLKQRTVRRQPETIIALIDVVFFLLVFFMLIGRMDATSPFDVTPPFAESGADLPAGGVTVAIADNGALALDGQVLNRSELISELEAALRRDPQQLVRMNAHKETRLHHVLPLVSALEQLGAYNIVFVVTPSPE